MHNKEHQDIGFEIQTRSKVKILLEEVKKTRNTISYYTIRQAFAHGPTTPTRTFILAKAKEILSKEIHN